VGHHHTQDKRRRQTNQKENTICVGHHHAQDKRRRQIKQKTQQYVLDTTIHKTKTKQHNTICVGDHHTQDKIRRQAKQKTQHNMCWTQTYTRQKTKTNKTNNTTQYVLDTTTHKKKDEDK
jgi:hypothetical protein